MIKLRIPPVTSSILALTCLTLWSAGALHAELRVPADAGLEAVITNYRVIEAGKLVRGGRPKTAGVQALAKANVHTIVDLQGGDYENRFLRVLVRKMSPGETPAAIAAERKEAEASGMIFINKPLNSMHHITAAEEITINETLAIMHDPDAQPVFVHCEHGNDRTGLLAALYRVRFDGWTAKAAHDEMVADGHKGFLDHLVTGRLDKFFFVKAKQLAKDYAADTSITKP